MTTKYIGLGELSEDEAERVLDALEAYGGGWLTDAIFSTLCGRVEDGRKRASLLGDGVRLPTKEEIAALLDGDPEIRDLATKQLDDCTVVPAEVGRAAARCDYEKVKELLRPMLGRLERPDARRNICCGILLTLVGICIYEELLDQEQAG